MGLENIINTVKDFFATVLNKPGQVVGVCVRDGKRIVEIEVTEEDEYMRRYGRHQLLGVYEVELNENREIVCFTRKELRERGKLQGVPQDQADPDRGIM